MLIDGLQCGFYDREVFEELRGGGFTCVTPTLGFWEGALNRSIDRALARPCARIFRPRSSRPFDRRHPQGARNQPRRDPPGFQNTNCLEDRIRYVELFAELGVQGMQLTYNNQNELGGSCYEEVDGGLARFGREVIREMNRAGILVDLSHVGEKTTLDTIEVVAKAGRRDTRERGVDLPPRRNKGDDDLDARCATTGGIIGCATYRNITPAAACDSLESWCEMVARTVDIAGIDHVGIGTDLSHKGNRAHLDWMRMGRWSRSRQLRRGLRREFRSRRRAALVDAVPRDLGEGAGGAGEARLQPPKRR